MRPSSHSWKAFRLFLLPFVVLLATLVTFTGCDSALDQEPFSQITPDQFFNTEAEFLAAAAAVYAQLRAVAVDNDGWMNLQTHASDEIMVPTRGPDWGDGGIWRALTQHTWTPTNPKVGAGWTNAQVGIARANGVLSALSSSDFDPTVKNRFDAEVRFLRALYYYTLMDLYGGVPIVVEEESPLASRYATQPIPADAPPQQNTRQEVFDFLLEELTGCTSSNFNASSCVGSPTGLLQNLAVKGDVPWGRATKGAGYALLARLLLNAEIYTGSASAGGIAPGQAMYEGAAAAADWVLNSGQYALENDYYAIFAANNAGSPEIIFPVTHKAAPGLGLNFQMRFLHYNLPIPQTPWNGFTTIAEFYKAYDVAPGADGELGTRDDTSPDARLQQFLVGLQYKQPSAGCAGQDCFGDVNSGVVLARDDQTPLFFSLEIPAIQLDAGLGRAAIESPGARPLKWEIDPATSGSEMGNDFPFFRLAEMYMIKAEAANELGNTGEALMNLNVIRARSGLDPLSGGSQDELRKLILQERGFEFVYEAQRRMDLIRYEFAHGGTPTGAPYTSSADPYAPTFTAPWIFKKDGSQSGQASEPYRVLFPIPSTQLSVNPNLTQNPGY